MEVDTNPFRDSRASGANSNSSGKKIKAPCTRLATIP